MILGILNSYSLHQPNYYILLILSTRKSLKILGYLILMKTSKPNSNSLYIEYFNYFKEFAAKYGENVAVFMEVGKFYEVYEISNDKEQLGNATILSTLMNIQLTKKDKKNHECNIKNPLMIGVPTFSIDKYTKILINNKFTIIFIDQDRASANNTGTSKKIIRNISNVISAGTYIESDCDTNNTICVFIDCVSNNQLYAGFSSIDITTGDCCVYEIFNTFDYVCDEIYRLIHTYKPVEMLFIDKNNLITDPRTKFDLNNIHFHTYPSLNWTDKDIKEQTNNSYQNLLLGKIYKNVGTLSPIEFINLEHSPTALSSFVFLCNFVYNHNENIISFIKTPMILQHNDMMILESNAIYQLDLTHMHSSQNKSLLELLSNTVTPIGRRMFKKILLNPINNIDILNKRYEYIDFFNNCFNEVRKLLQIKKYDLEKLYRKIQLTIIHPYELFNFIETIKSSIPVLKFNKIDMTEHDFDHLNIFICNLDTTFNMEELSKYNRDLISTNIFIKGVYQDVDSIEDLIQDLHKNIEDIQKKVCDVVDFTNQKTPKSSWGTPTPSVRVEYTDNDGFFLATTSKRAGIIKKSDIANTLGLTFKSTPSESVVRIKSPEIEQLSFKLISYKQRLSKLCVNHLNEFCESIIKTSVNTLLLLFFDTIALIDHYSCCAYNAHKFRYCKPSLISSINSSIVANDLRHPLIEVINTSEIYVPNDISIGIDYNGFLLYGTNMCGKSSLMKAIGLSIILAQSGMFVPCSSMMISPFNSLYTRIDGNDNLYKGDSSFAVEMKELRTILHKSDANTIVLGDEVCKGTEHISATSIIASSIDYMTNTLNTRYVFATHIHELAKIPIIVNNTNIKFCHLSINRVNNKITYNRKLQDGIGDSIYGLEVAKAIQINQTVIDGAIAIRNQLLGKKKLIVDTKKSRYNAQVYVDVCEICGKPAEHTHHINHQADADKDGYIDHYHKNIKANLMVLCEICHHSIHNN